MFQATRRRLALWYTTVTAILLLLFASSFYLYVRSTLVERVDDTLHHVVEVVQRSLVLEPISSSPGNIPYQVNLEASFRSNAEAVEDDHIDLEWYSPTGELLWSTFTDPLQQPIRLSDGGETVWVKPDHWLRQLTERLEIKDQVLGYLRVSHPWFEVTKPTQALFIDLSIGLSLVIGLVAAIGWFLSSLAMEPIRASYQYLRQFTADASHELRNPIALIQTNVQVALTETDPALQEQRQQLEVIERLTRRLSRLVDDLLFLTRQDSGMIQPQFQPCPLDALLMEVVEEQSPLAQEKGIALNLDLQQPPGTTVIPGEEPFTLQGDDDQLAHLFTNLVSNAMQYTPASGKITLTVSSLRRGGTPYLQIQVNDTGIGIPEAALPHLFERFYRVEPTRTKASQKSVQQSNQKMPAASPTGSGLGLAIAQAIVQNHQGQIQVESTLHQGTTVTVLLPQIVRREPLVKSAKLA